MTTNVYATTYLISNRGKVYEYAIHFIVDENGKIRFVEEAGVLPIRPYMLLHLVREVYEAMGLTFTSEKGVEFVMNKAHHGRVHPALELVHKHKRYRLDQEVSGRWISNPDVPAMVQYIVDLPKDTEELVYLLAYEYPEPGYYLLNPESSVSWKIFFQEA